MAEFAYRWDLLEARLPEPTSTGRWLRRAVAIETLVDRYVRGAVFTNERALARLFSVPRAEVGGAIARLARAGALTDAVVPDWPGRWIVHAGAAARA